MTPQGIDRLRSLADEQIACLEDHRRCLLGFAFHRDEPHGRALGRFADRLGVRSVVLLPLDERLDIVGGDQPDLVPQFADLAAPVMGTAACFHRHHALRLGSQERQQPIARELGAQEH
jgi:hypothetical protein